MPVLRTILNKLFRRTSTVQAPAPQDAGISTEFSWWESDPSSSESTFGFIDEDTWSEEAHVYATDLNTFTLELDPEDDPCQ